MTRTILILSALLTAIVLSSSAHSATPLNTCNQSTGECRARLITVYSVGDFAYAVLEGHIKPTFCTGAAWGYYWQLPLVTNADKARYSLLISAYALGEAVELRASAADCTITTVGIGE